jgi:DNA-binding GntR family transcriptional regulator
MTNFPYSGNSLVKDQLALLLREEIIGGRLQPGDRIVEAKWAQKLGVAQASVREALNILSGEGFVEKDVGRSARVTLLTEEDLRQIYELRQTIEGLAARLVVEKQADLSELEQVLADMRSAAECKNARAFYERDVRFHLLIAEKAANRYLEQTLKRLIVPLFAFVTLRIHGATGNPEYWPKSIEQHRKILEALHSGDAFFAEHQVKRTIKKFYEGTHRVLTEQPLEGN